MGLWAANSSLDVPRIWEKQVPNGALLLGASFGPGSDPPPSRWALRSSAGGPAGPFPVPSFLWELARTIGGGASPPFTCEELGAREAEGAAWRAEPPGLRCGLGTRLFLPPSRSTFGKLWQESRVALKELLAQELPAQPTKPERNRAVFFHTVATLYLRYIQTARRLEVCYDQMVQPQKRLVLRPLLEGVLGRILELKQELVELDLSEYHYMDQVLEELKLTPVSPGRAAGAGGAECGGERSCGADMEVPIPKYFLHERAKILQDRQDLLTGLLNQMGPTKSQVGSAVSAPSLGTGL
uniref:IQ and AAA domain-containing protein 1-like n=1 Tax=Podarcis muralis TaxID=64176 RepID=UPI0010A0A8FD|nr:IQ and AAA domain-containing protein 1-like [Podarcis muralis]